MTSAQLSAGDGSGWKNAPEIALGYDFTYRRPESNPSTARIAEDGSALYVAFEVRQPGGITANQHTNGSSVLNDDYVAVLLNPQGQQGFSYAFYANPIGTRYQTSSENSAYAPEWSAIGKRTAGGYEVTMRIPLNIIRSGGSSSWRVQFESYSVATNSVDIWAYSPIATSPNDPTFEGTVTGIGIAPAGSKASGFSRNPARMQLYALGESTTPANGGSTSRLGADFSLPVTPTASFVGTLHPDYSNVETDQQTIAPTAFERQYAEVRPFFTQMAQFFNGHFSCSNCPQTLYTPAIPAFAQGYGIEGTQGRFTFAGFDALGYQRTDQAQTLNYSYEDPRQSENWGLQRVAVDAYGLNDDTTTLDGGYLDQRNHFGIYTNNGYESGSLVTDTALAQYHDLGLIYLTQTTIVQAGIQRIGAQFSPLDGYVSQTDILGNQVYAQHTFTFTPKYWLHDLQISDYYGDYSNHLGQVAQVDQDPNINLDFRNLVSLHLFTSSNVDRTQNGEFLPFDGNGFLLGYRANTNTPSIITYNGGEYYHGHINAWTYMTTVPVTPRVHLSLEADRDAYLSVWPGESSSTQWLERTSLDWQPNRFTQLDLGLRRILGPNMPNAFEPLTYGSMSNPNSPCFADPYAAGCFVNAGNVSMALHFLAARNEFYLVYGNANNLSTEPALFIKWIRYLGAEKGT